MPFWIYFCSCFIGVFVKALDSPSDLVMVKLNFFGLFSGITSIGTASFIVQGPMLTHMYSKSLSFLKSICIGTWILYVNMPPNYWAGYSSDCEISYWIDLSKTFLIFVYYLKMKKNQMQAGIRLGKHQQSLQCHRNNSSCDFDNITACT